MKKLNIAYHKNTDSSTKSNTLYRSKHKIILTLITLYNIGYLFTLTQFYSPKRFEQKNFSYILHNIVSFFDDGRDSCRNIGCHTGFQPGLKLEKSMFIKFTTKIYFR